MIRLACALLACAGGVFAETAVQRLLEDRMLFGRIRAISESIHGPLGVAAIDLKTGRVFVFNAEAEFPAASTIKIPILVELFREAGAGRIRLGDLVTLSPGDAVGGDGALKDQLARGQVTLTIRDLIAAMIEHSDNTATNRCISLTGMGPVNRLLAENGMRATHLRRVMMDSAAAARDEENTTSPLDMARFAESLYRGRLADAGATRDMIDVLKRVDADVRRAIPAAIPVASKYGDLTGVHCEVAIVYLPDRPFILSVYSSFLDEDENPVPAVAKAAFAYFRKLASSNQFGNQVR
jgi:beta-lactamase class A